MAETGYFAFILAALALAIVPGPTVTVIVANSLKFGTRAGLMNVLGTQLGVVAWLIVAVFGLTAAISVLGPWFLALRLIGAAYLVWLGLKLWRSNGALAEGSARWAPGGSFFWQGLVVIISNPKMLVLFGALIPPFIPKGGNVMAETFKLGLTFALIAAATDTIYALLAGRAGAFLSHGRLKALERVAGACLIGGAAWMTWQAISV